MDRRMDQIKTERGARSICKRLGLNGLTTNTPMLDVSPTDYVDKGGYKLRAAARLNPVYVFNKRITTIKHEVIDLGEVVDKANNPKSILKNYCTRYSAANRQQNSKRVNFQINNTEEALVIKKEPKFDDTSSLGCVKLPVDVSVKQELGPDTNMFRRVTRQMTNKSIQDKKCDIQTTLLRNPEQKSDSRSAKKGKRMCVQKCINVELNNGKIKQEVESDEETKMSNTRRVTRQSTRQAFSLLNENYPQKTQTQQKASLKQIQDANENAKPAVTSTLHGLPYLQIKQEPVDTIDIINDAAEKNNYEETDAIQETNTSNYFDTRRVTRQSKKLHSAMSHKKQEKNPTVFKKIKGKFVKSSTTEVKEEDSYENEMLQRNLQDPFMTKKEIENMIWEETISNDCIAERFNHKLEDSLLKTNDTLLKQETLSQTPNNSNRNSVNVDVRIDPAFLNCGRNKAGLNVESTQKHNNLLCSSAKRCSRCRVKPYTQVKGEVKLHPSSTCTTLDLGGILKPTECVDLTSMHRNNCVKIDLNAYSKDTTHGTLPCSMVNEMNYNQAEKSVGRNSTYQRGDVEFTSAPPVLKIKRENESDPTTGYEASIAGPQRGDEANRNSEALPESANTSRNCETQATNFNPDHILRDLISADGTMTVRTKTGYIVRVKVTLNHDRPNFGSERDNMMWEVGTIVNILRLRAQIESGEYMPPDAEVRVDTHPIAPVPESETERAENLLKIKTNEAKFLGTELEMVNVITDIREKLTEHCDPNSYSLLLERLLALDIKPLMLKKHPMVVDTIHTLCNFSGQKPVKYSLEAREIYDRQVERIKEMALKIYANFETLFRVPTGTTFYNYLLQCKDLLWKTCNFEAGRVFTLVNDPFE